MSDTELYGRGELLEADAPEGHPLPLFSAWLREAGQHRKELFEPTAMALATVGEDGHPSVRMVLLKAHSEAGFVFYTNNHSRKGRELQEDGWAAATFWWGILQRQVRIEGHVHAVSATQADAYFARRPHGSQLSAWVSQQSQPVANRQALAAQLQAGQQRFGDGEIPRPTHWSGWRIVPDSIEFWQGRPDRMHDRLLYTRHHSGWSRTRLQP